jgi:hypothetical protein
MPLSSYLTKPLGWLRAGYSARAPCHGYVPLLALMPSPAARTGDPLERMNIRPVTRVCGPWPDQVVAAAASGLPMRAPRPASASVLAR